MLKTCGRFSRIFPKTVHLKFMKYNETQKYGTYLRKLSTEEIDKLLSSLLQEMRRRDSEHVKGDVLANSKALYKLRPGFD